MQPSPRFTHPLSIAGASVVVVALLVALALALPTISSADQRARATATPGTSARVNSCVSAVTYDRRKIAFSGRMSAQANSNGGKMQMRFDVLRKYNESRRYRLLTAEGLGQWLGNTEPTATIYVRNVSLAKIETGARYMARVRYRWLDADGKVIARKIRTTKVCKQTAPLPGPQLLSLTKFPNPGLPTTTYVARIYNTSKSEAINLPVSLAIDGQTPVTQTIDSIEGKELVNLTFTDLPVCTQEKYLRIDPLNVVRTQNENRNDTRDVC